MLGGVHHISCKFEPKGRSFSICLSLICLNFVLTIATKIKLKSLINLKRLNCQKANRLSQWLYFRQAFKDGCQEPGIIIFQLSFIFNSQDVLSKNIGKNLMNMVTWCWIPKSNSHFSGALFCENVFTNGTSMI